MARLSATERDAVVLRYFQNKTLAEVGAALGLEERAAQKRVGRALEKLRIFFTKRGVVSTTAIIAAELSANSIHAAPVALAKLVTPVAVAKGSTAAVSTLTLVKGTLKLMTWIKVKFAIGLGVVGLGIGTTLVVAQLATQPKHLQVPTGKEPPQLVVIYSGKQVVAELRIKKAGILDLQAGDISWTTRNAKTTTVALAELSWSCWLKASRFSRCRVIACCSWMRTRTSRSSDQRRGYCECHLKRRLEGDRGKKLTR